jgi:peptide/nickel transport system permease protein
MLLTYTLRRLVEAVPLLLVISMALFGLLHLIPGGPEQVALSPRLSPDARHALVVALGLDQPLPVQYVKWLWGVVHLNFGASYADGQPVILVVQDRVPATLELLGTGFAVALLVAVPLGIVSALTQYSPIDHVLTVAAYLGISMPIFWFAEMLVLLLALHLGWFPTGGRGSDVGPPSLLDGLHHLILPALVLALFFIASWSRYVRSSMLEVLPQDYLRTARAKGLPRRRVVVKHAARNALLPLITVVALDVGSIFGGAVITETIFSWPGLGRLFFDALSARDYPVLMAIMVLSACTVVVCNLAADLVYGLLDPRVRYEA